MHVSIMQRVRDWLMDSGSESESFSLSVREQFAMMGVVLLANGVLMGLTWLIGWHDWWVDYGRATLLPPTLISCGSFYWWRRRAAIREGRLPEPRGTHRDGCFGEGDRVA